MKPLNALVPADFPGYDADGIQEWLGEVKRARSVLGAMYAVLAAFILLALAMEPTLLLLAVVLAVVLPVLVYHRSRALRHELHLTHHIIGQARRGELRPPQPVEQPAAPEPETVHAG